MTPIGTLKVASRIKGLASIAARHSFLMLGA
jgi:hypothetical protein